MKNIPQNYQAPDASVWQGRMDGSDRSRYHRVVKSVDLSQNNSLESRSISLIGFACDIGVHRNKGFVGAVEGPYALKKRLASLAFHGSKEQAIYDVGTVTAEGDNLEIAQEGLAEIVANTSSQNSLPLVIGGGHELAFAQYKGLIQAHPEKSIALLNIDAHFDMRPLENGKGNSGTSFNQIAQFCEENKKEFHYMAYGIQPEGNTNTLFEKAKELKGEYVTAEEIHKNSSESFGKFLDYLDKYDYIYPSICMDVFSQAFAPGVSARSPMGLFPWHVVSLVQALAKSGKVLGSGIAELAPNRDKEESTVNLVAGLVGNFIAHYKSSL